VITLVVCKTDNNVNRMIIITEFALNWKKLNCLKVGTYVAKK
jgi:hypothetical protein